MASPYDVWTLPDAHVGRRVLQFAQLASTNTTAAELAATPDAEGIVVIADFQTAGRGQYGRVWQSRPGSSLLTSVVLQPPPELRRPALLTAFAAVGVAEAIRTMVGVQARVKWPNDLLIRGKKVSGILIEQHGSSAILGLGLNLNQSAEEFEAAGLPDATSLAIVAGHSFDLRIVAEVVLRQLDREYSRLLGEERVAVESDWKWRVDLLGRLVQVEFTDGSVIVGRLREMAFDGLDLELAEGSVRVIVPETVRHLMAK